MFLLPNVTMFVNVHNVCQSSMFTMFVNVHNVFILIQPSQCDNVGCSIEGLVVSRAVADGVEFQESGWDSDDRSK